MCIHILLRDKVANAQNEVLLPLSLLGLSGGKHGDLVLTEVVRAFSAINTSVHSPVLPTLSSSNILISTMFFIVFT